jgi:uncharacterized membrane protein
MDLYPWLKALHIAAVVTWIGGMLASGIALATFYNREGAAERAGRLGALGAIHRWDRRVTSPAMALVWVLGLALAIQGDWFGASWLTVKLLLVFGLSALHGMLSGTFNRLARADQPPVPASLRHASIMTIAGAIAIIILVVVKPF